ncbi:hypothetical protein JOB18_037802 [Solea senegalensis]|uniref:Ig-like domain-containing protein n=1 Tax=Solea senegalensis TaxID=28829 RepID=A0AAV6QE18_SOLSE|nr:uncharacterized protein LOC122770468 [Solea senegalensis]KAG7486740.1 hypothetical protein JOB18_037802 [Solea senegalensis]KAG7486741.1 hypothetical protein JOB18_037802 [Solea senegalensis]KAG7486742.1 hypothetical protein JOB18_037802 [Solea senegalensis]
MEPTALHVLCLASVFTLTTQELVGLRVSPKITAECGKQVTLQCNVSSSLNGLSVKHMEWSYRKMHLCSVNSEGNISYSRDTDKIWDFYCEYEEGQLSLVFRTAQPDLQNEYRCKLQSNKGAPHKYTTVELEECDGTVSGVLTSDGPSCTFNHVHPDRDVHWFLGSKNLSDGSANHNTTKSVEKGGWITIHSDLEWKEGSDEPFNCSLKSTKSGRYTASTLIQKAALKSLKATNGVRPQESMAAFLCVSLLFAVMLS